MEVKLWLISSIFPQVEAADVDAGNFLCNVALLLIRATTVIALYIHS